ncbi:MAG: hypothetical protein H0X27_11215, partial [Caulobacteraceae bacterium]|nr:hypothetical protein [Caulobacteraceae bacterium]
MNAYVGHRKLDVRARIGTGAGTPYTHTLGEMLQLIGVLRGDVTLPAEVKRLAGFKAAFQPLPGIGDFGEVEVVLVEASTPVEILYDNIVLQRNSIVQHIIAPLRLAHPQPAVRKLSSRWIFHGLLRQDEEPQTLGRQLAKLVPDSMPLADIARDVLVNARAVRRLTTHQKSLALRNRDVIRGIRFDWAEDFGWAGLKRWRRRS